MLVETAAQVAANLRTLEHLRSRPLDDGHRAYEQLIKRGTCFVPYVVDGGIAFAPSRFIGYQDNSIERHLANTGKDGRTTNKALHGIFGSGPQIHDGLERLYVAFCNRLRIAPSATGAFGVARKYWVTDEVLDTLDQAVCDDIETDLTLGRTEKEQLMKARLGQGLFRQALIDYWGHCAVSGCTLVSVLRASHIKPWREASNAERLDPFNGLLLAPNIDALFDKALISFARDGAILISKKLSARDRLALGIDAGFSVPTTPRHEPYLSLHRARFQSQEED